MSGPVGSFRRVGEECVATFAADEQRVLRRVVGELAELLADRPDHTDPVVQRLFPDPYPDRPRDAADYRRYTEAELRGGKRRQAEELLATLAAPGDEVRLDKAAADTWLRTLTDLRLALAVRLGVTAGMDLMAEIDAAAGADPPSRRAFHLSVYAYLGFLQESLLEALTA